MPETLEKTELVLPTESTAVLMFERLAADPNVPVDKLEKVIELYERVQRNIAEAAFNAAFSEMADAMPTVSKNGKSLNGPYAKFEDIVETVRPVLHRFGFSMSHKTTFPPGKVLVTGILRHRQGHRETTDFEATADTTGNKNAIQALGSADSYGRRYTTQSLLFLASRDDNAHATNTRTSEPELPKPDGYDDWLTDLSAAADLGKPAVDKAWTMSKGVFKAYLTKMDRRTWEGIKARAARVTS